MLQRIGSWVFIIGVIIAVVIPIFADLDARLAAILVILGLVIGFLNITVSETQSFLLAALALVIVAGLGGASGLMAQVPGIGLALGRIFNAIMLLVVPATIIVALRSIYALARKA